MSNEGIVVVQCVCVRGEGSSLFLFVSYGSVKILASHFPCGAPLHADLTGNILKLLKDRNKLVCMQQIEPKKSHPEPKSVIATDFQLLYNMQMATVIKKYEIPL